MKDMPLTMAIQEGVKLSLKQSKFYQQLERYIKLSQYPHPSMCVYSFKYGLWVYQ